MTADMVNGERGGLSKRGLARALGVSPSMVLKLEARGMPVHAVEAAKAWRATNLDPLRIKASGAKAERTGRADALMAARLDREETEAALARLKLAELAGDLVRVAEVRQALARACVAHREALMSMAHRLAAVAAAETDPARVFAMIERDVTHALALLASGAHVGSEAHGAPDDGGTR